MLSAVVLAAGASTRFGSPKQAVLLEPVLERVRASSSIDDVVVVLGAHDVDTDATTVRCAEWERGPGASLRCGLAALADDVERAVVVLADGPELDPRAVERLLAHEAPVAAATYDGSRSHPVAYARPWPEIPDAGGRALEAVLVDCSDLRPPGD